ncbi:MAG: hypothetical protein ACE149_01110 [Armatimonadota bacterium]
MSATQDANRSAPRADQPAPRWLALAELVLGSALAGSAGIWAGQAWSANRPILYLPGLVTLVCGAALAVAGAQHGRPLAHSKNHIRELRELLQHSGEPGEAALPLLGELLLHKYHLITERQLEDALALQRKHGGQLGHILIGMGLIDDHQLCKVLEDQQSYGDPWRKTAPKPEWEESWRARAEAVSAAEAADE